ncbi:MAG: hypothetical protein PHG67_02115 [Bacteroidales bacterium]|jgi:hypothetical protein|nr:hypothetical protein [Bacteroidales bacterium]HOI31655.1 hypothetical protein [Bacteroidales bacterium]
MQQNENQSLRPGLLTFLCVLSFIGSGLAAVSNFFVYFNHTVVLEMIEQESFEAMGFDFSLFGRIDRSYFLISAFLQVISFNGVRLMWNLRRTGFHLYAISQLLMLIISTIYIYKPEDVFPMFDLVLATLFILLYLRFRDRMN